MYSLEAFGKVLGDDILLIIRSGSYQTQAPAGSGTCRTPYRARGGV